MKYSRLLTLSAIVLIAACGQDSSNPLAPGDAGTAKGGTPGKPLPPPEPIAANPKYQSSTYSVTSLGQDAGFHLNHAFKQVGLGNFSTVDYVLTATFQAVFDCRNKGGQLMPESSPWHVNAGVSGSETIEPQNGSVNAILTLTGFRPADGAAGCGGEDASPAQKNFFWQLRPNTAKWANIKFCWGQSIAMQGPVPDGVGANVQMTPASGNISGLPTDGDVYLGDGIYSTSCLAS